MFFLSSLVLSPSSAEAAAKAAARNQRARGNGGHGLLTLIRAVTGRVGFRGVDWGCGFLFLALLTAVAHFNPTLTISVWCN
jgi:hypothetical protein